MDYQANHRRLDDVTGRWGLIIPDECENLFRKSRETRGLIPEPDAHVETCFYCPGHTQLTNKDIFTMSTPEGIIRVTTKKKMEVFVTEKPVNEADGRYSCANAYGVAETVVIGEPHHQRISTLPDLLLAASLEAVKNRILSLNEIKFLKHIMFYADGNNTNDEVGFIHPTWHIKGTNILKPRVTEKVSQSHRHFLTKERCLMCDIIKEETRVDLRIVEKTMNFMVISPYAARHPFETWIVPLRHNAYFETHNQHLSDQGLYWLELASVIKRLIQKLEIFLGPRFLYSLALNNTPLAYPQHENIKINLEDACHWHLRLKPYLKPTSIREDVEDESVNPLSPELATKLLQSSQQKP